MVHTVSITSQQQRGHNMTGTLRITENGSHTWVQNTTLDFSVERLNKLGSVKQSKTEKYIRLNVTRFDGSRFTAKFFPVNN
jgi:hypothetical protein